MSVEAYVIAKLVEERSIQKALQEGLTPDDFEIHDEEFAWLLNRAEAHKPITPRLFKKQFPEFDLIQSGEAILDLIEELKTERAFVAVSSAIDELFTGEDALDQENALRKAQELREILGGVIRLHARNSDVAIKGEWEDAYARVRNLSILRQNGERAGIPTEIAHFDHHFGGLQKETSYLFLGRPGDAKSMMVAKLAVEAAWNGYRVGFFSPEMTRHQHECRFWTMLSAKPEVQESLNLRGSFRNRSLYHGQGFNLKQFRRFLQWLDDNLTGEIHLFTQKYRRDKMGLGFIESRIAELGIDLVIIDPIYKLRPPRRRGTRWEELGEITDGIIDLAHTFNIPVVMSNQASRALVGRRGDAPDKDSSFGSDTPVQEANCVIGVKHFSEERIMKVNCTKNRDGEPFKFTAKFFPNVGVLEDVTPIQGDYINGYDHDLAVKLADEMKEAGI